VTRPCFSCHGTGRVRFLSARVHSAFANGRGRLVRCFTCKGTGRVERPATAPDAGQTEE
jgi:DnaJ-class molecular chaperone